MRLIKAINRFFSVAIIAALILIPCNTSAKADDETLFMTVYEDTIFYSNKSDDDKLYKINTNGTGKVKLSNNKATFINASKEYVYYVNYSDNENLYKIPASGGKSIKITNEYGTNITVLKDKIYFDGMFCKK